MKRLRATASWGSLATLQRGQHGTVIRPMLGHGASKKHFGGMWSRVVPGSSPQKTQRHAIRGLKGRGRRTAVHLRQRRPLAAPVLPFPICRLNQTGDVLSICIGQWMRRGGGRAWACFSAFGDGVSGEVNDY